MKSVVARYSTGSGITSEFLVPKIREIITALYVYGFIVNSISGDGASENRSAFKQLATIPAKDIFKVRVMLLYDFRLDERLQVDLK
jgi:hypothetical protein